MGPNPIEQGIQKEGHNPGTAHFQRFQQCPSSHQARLPLPDARLA